MRTIALTILLLAAAAPAHGATFRVEATAARQRKPADPPASQDPAGHWSPKLRATVMHQCQDTFPDQAICSCFTHQLEVLSGDSDAVTSENMQAALKLCTDV